MTHGFDRRDPFTLRFTDPRLEEEYERDLAAADRADCASQASPGALSGRWLRWWDLRFSQIPRAPITIAAIVVSVMNAISLTLLHLRPTTLRTQRRLLIAINLTSAVAVVVVPLFPGYPASLHRH